MSLAVNVGGVVEAIHLFMQKPGTKNGSEVEGNEDGLSERTVKESLRDSSEKRLQRDLKAVV